VLEVGITIESGFGEILSNPRNDAMAPAFLMKKAKQLPNGEAMRLAAGFNFFR
jgi:hypothetical protein